MGTDQARISRALSSYYKAKRAGMDDASAYRRIVDLEQRLRSFGDAVDERLQGVPEPAEISALYSGESPLLASTYFGKQIRNLHDGMAASDILDMRVASLEYLGFDTHEEQRVEIESRFHDLFGHGMALNTLWDTLPADARANSVFVLAGEFGRQIRANGDGGTDHGEGNLVLVIGEGVNGGVYGDLFPEAELSRLDAPSPQIDGLTGMEHLFASVCDWVQPGAGDLVFPNRASAPMEAGLDLSTLFT